MSILSKILQCGQFVLEKVKFACLDMSAMNQNNQYEQILSHITYKLSSKFKFLTTLGLGTMEFGQVMKFW